MQHPSTPIAKPRRRCTNCPCQDFQSDTSITSAIQSEARTTSLIDWLSGKHLTNDANTNKCTHRLHASIVILNSIRDVCRLHLESSAASSSEKLKSTDESAKKKQQQTIWEDSFPALSSAATAVTPTILFGRRKEVESDGKKQACQLQTKHHSDNKDSCDGHKASENGKTQQVISKPKVKKKIKPVMISSVPTTTASAWGSSSNSAVSTWGAKGNIASLPSQPLMVQKKPAAAETTTVCNGTSSSASLSTPVKHSVSCSTPNCSTSGQSKNPQLDMKDSNEQLVRLVNVYATILKNQLAPYLLLELHLLIRLISVSGECKPNNSNEATIPFDTIFHSHQACRTFASQTIMAIEPLILSLGHDTIKVLVSLHSLRKECPILTEKMQQLIELNNSTLLFESGEKALGGNTNTPHITLPFDHARDSRHNYRSADRNRLFKEREELRDSFLFQLRAFQDVRGRLMEEEVSSKIIANIEVESRKMLQGLGVGNLGWFVNFFCDLLLQIGLVPIGETDSDVLKQVADQKRLQKLHKRFTSKGNQNNKHSSSRKLTIDQKHTSGDTGSSLPGQCFRGHQEFFALFLNAGDSYKFNTQLKRRLSQLITEMTSVNETKGLCQQITKTMLLAKFLGLLVFGPNYVVGGETSEITPEVVSASSDEKPPIDLSVHLQKAWSDYRLVITIPWTVEFLRMMKWDVASKKNQYYTNAFALLWSINSHCFSHPLNGQNVLSTNMLLLSLQLANLFHDVVGTVNAWELPAISLSQRFTVESSSNAKLIPLDTMPLWFNKTYLFSTTSYSQDLFELVSHLQSATNSSSKLGSSSTKKIRPRPISSGPLKDFVESNSFQRVSPLRSSFSSPMSSPWSSSKSLSADPGSKAATKDKLIDCFFHQHQELQQLCETTIDLAIKHFAQSTLQRCITPIFMEKATSYEEFFGRSPSMEVNKYIELLQSLDVSANLKAREEMNNQFGRIIRGTLELLSPPDTQPKVREIACSLALQHASDKGDQIIRSFAREEKKRLVDEFIRKERKVKAGVPLKATSRIKTESIKSTYPAGDVDTIVNLNNLLDSIHDIDEVDVQLLEQLDQAIEKITHYMRKYCIGSDPPPSVQAFQAHVMKLLQKYFSSDPPMPSLFLCVLFKVSGLLCLFCKMGYRDTATSREFEHTITDSDKFIKAVGAAARDVLDESTIGTFLFQLIDCSIVGYSLLEDALMKLMSSSDDQHLETVAGVLMNKLASSLGFSDWRDDGFVIMVRLQRMIS